MLTEKLFGVISLGCDKNRVDTEKMLGLIKSHGYNTTDDLNKAQIVIINTCAFLQSARKEAIDTILECAEYKTKNLEKLVVTGCLPQKFIDELYEPLEEVDVFLGIQDYEKLFEALENSYKNDQRQNFVGQGKDGYIHDRVLTTDEHYAYLKIADGCYNHCTYCLIPKIRGGFRSIEKSVLISEAKLLGEVKELILVAQDLTSYGVDLTPKSSLVELIKELSKLDNISKIPSLYSFLNQKGLSFGLLDKIFFKNADTYNRKKTLLKYASKEGLSQQEQ